LPQTMNQMNDMFGLVKAFLQIYQCLVAFNIVSKW
jgi:hypothetical protein